MATIWECSECLRKFSTFAELCRHRINAHDNKPVKESIREYEVPKVDYKRGKNEDQKD